VDTGKFLGSHDGGVFSLEDGNNLGNGVHFSGSFLGLLGINVVVGILFSMGVLKVGLSVLQHKFLLDELRLEVGENSVESVDFRVRNSDGLDKVDLDAGHFAKEGGIVSHSYLVESGIVLEGSLDGVSELLNSANGMGELLVIESHGDGDQGSDGVSGSNLLQRVDELVLLDEALSSVEFGAELVDDFGKSTDDVVLVLLSLDEGGDIGGLGSVELDSLLLKEDNLSLEVGEVSLFLVEGEGVGADFRV